MAQHGAVNGERGRGGLLRPCLVVLLAGFFGGCQAPASHFDRESPGGIESPRPVVLAGQLASDSALELAAHPIRTTASGLAETADTLAAAGCGLVGKRVLLPLRGLPGPVDPSQAALDAGALERELRRLTGHDLQPVCLTFSPQGQEALTSLLHLIDSATCQIDVLMFLWESDRVGSVIAEHLAARAAAGVKVRVLMDRGGNLIYSEPEDASASEVDRTVAWLSRQANVDVLRIRNGWGRFDHRKLVVVDGRTAWTGGRNFRDEAFGQQRDLSFIVTGPLVGELSREFENSWIEQGGKNESRPAAAFEDGKCPDLARVIGTGPLRHDLADTIFAAIDSARHHVYLENPYLCDSRLLLRLAEARRRGVDVRVVLPLETSPAIVGRANRVTANYLLRAGVRVYLYQGLTHVKALSVDDAWAYVGTGNFDPLSLRHDWEVGLAIGAGPAIREVEEGLLVPDFQSNWELHEPLPVTVHDSLSEILACLFG